MSGPHEIALDHWLEAGGDAPVPEGVSPSAAAEHATTDAALRALLGDPAPWSTPSSADAPLPRPASPPPGATLC